MPSSILYCMFPPRGRLLGVLRYLLYVAIEKIVTWLIKVLKIPLWSIAKFMDKNPTSGKNILTCHKELLHRKENEFDCLLPFSGVVGHSGKRDCKFWHNVKEKYVYRQPIKPIFGLLNAYCNPQKVSKCKSDKKWPKWLTFRGKDWEFSSISNICLLHPPGGGWLP